jgi:hypothetical protein
MKPPMAIVYRWRHNRLEFADRAETRLPLALRLGWTLLVKDSEVLTTAAKDAAYGEQQQD